jgi:hypothetical protein
MTAGPNSVSVELPPGWLATNARGLLSALVTETAQGALAAETNPEFARGLLDMAPAVLAGLDVAGIALTGFRARPGHLDLVTVALPPADTEAVGQPPAAAAGDAIHWVDLGENVGIEHVGSEATDPSEESTIGSSVQLVTIVPGSHQGVVITAQSTESGVERGLESTVRQVADSMCVIPAADGS